MGIKHKSYDVFISCKSEDYHIAEEIYDFLNDNGVSTFFACKSLPETGNADYFGEILDALDECKHLIVFCTKADYACSKYVKFGWSSFINEKFSGKKNGNILTIIGEDVKIPDLPFGLRRFEVLDFNKFRDSLLNYVRDFNDLTIDVNGVDIEMIAVNGDKFLIGAQTTNPLGQNYDCDAWDNESPEHSVCVDDFYIAKNQVTQELWQAVMGDCPSHNKGEKFPVENVSWYDCQNFILKLNVITGMEFRLPTEAEWEYAAKGGIKSRGFKFSGDDDIDKVCWFCNNSGDEKLFDDSCGLKSNEILKLNNCKPHPVGLKVKNELGIYDMSGNVYEWCQDIYDSYGSKLINDCPETMAQKYYVCRGGSWCSYPRNCRVTSRHSATPDHKDYDIGFRLALSKKVK